jgi:hypothetical protein
MTMRERHNWSQIRGEEGISLITVMMVILIMTLMGISILSVTGFERQVSHAVSASAASTDAAESCVSTGAKVVMEFLNDGGTVPATLLSNAVPPGPVPFGNLAVLQNELILDGANPDVPVGPGSVPNLVMPIGNNQVFGDIDRLYMSVVAGSGTDPNAGTSLQDYFYQITCVAQDGITGVTSQVGAVYVCNSTGSYCQLRGY